MTSGVQNSFGTYWLALNLTMQLLLSFKFCSHHADHTHTHPLNGPLSGTTRVGRYQKGKTNLDFTGARDSEWQWHQLGYMQVCTSHQIDNHTSNPPLSFLQAGCPSSHPTNSVKALKADESGRIPFLPTVSKQLTCLVLPSPIEWLLEKVTSHQLHASTTKTNNSFHDNLRGR